MKGAQPRATGEEDDDDFMDVLMPGPINDRVNPDSDVHERRIGAFHEGFGPSRSQMIGIDRGPERVVIERSGTPVTTNIGDRYPMRVCAA